MANRSSAAATATDDLRRHLSVDTPPLPIPKDMQGYDNPIPLSPQWLLPKPVDKLGILSGEPHSSPHHDNRPDAVKASGIDEDFHDTGKKKDVFRPSSYAMDSGRHDRWRDEERETPTDVRRDRWRETEKELREPRRADRWSDNSVRHSSEAHRAPSERWTDSGNNRDNNYDQRRESKWNTRWGSNDKDLENRYDKRSDSSKGYEGSRDKGTSQLTPPGKERTNQGKDTDKEGEHSRSWRPNSFIARGRGDTNLPLPLTPNKQAPPFGYAKVKGESGASFFSAGRGRVDNTTGSPNNDTSRSFPLGFTPERSDGAHCDPFTLRYSRMKLLDIFRMTDLKSLRMSWVGFADVPSITIVEPLEPLALSALTSEEMVTLKAIDKGDIVSSGLPQVSKEGSTGKNVADSVTSKQPRSGNREDMTFAHGDCNDESNNSTRDDYSHYLEGPYARHSHLHGLDSNMASSHSYQENKLALEASRSDDTLKSVDEMGTEVSMVERSTSHHSIPWRSQSAGEHSHGSSQSLQDYSIEARTRTSDVYRPPMQKNLETEQKNIMTGSSSYFRDESHWQNNHPHSEQRVDFNMKRQSSEISDIERVRIHGDPFISSKLSPPLSPEDLSLYYKDPHGRIQGPFTGTDLIGWFEAGYFGIDLQVRVASAHVDTPFSSLGDVMPHLRAKVRPPPGFGVAQQNDVTTAASLGKFGSLGNNAHSAMGELEAFKNMQRNSHGPATQAENRFIESLMSGNMNNTSSDHYPLVEGMRGYGGPPSRAEAMNDLNYLLAQKMSLERQQSVPTALPSLLSKFLPHVGDPTHQIPQSTQQVDFLSMLQAAADKPASSPAGWPNRSEVPTLNNLVHGGMNMIKNKIDMHPNQHITSQTGFETKNQVLHPESQPSLSHLLCQPGSLSSGVAPTEKLLSELSQDPQLLSLLQQQYLMSQIQLQSHSSLPSHLSLLDKYLLLKQQEQQKREQQKREQLLLQQQQQHLLSQVLSGHQHHQHFGEPSFGHLNPSLSLGNASMDCLGINQIHEALHNNQIPAINSIDGYLSNLSNLNVQGPKDASSTVSSGPPPHLPHQMFDHTPQPEKLDIPHQMFDHTPQPEKLDIPHQMFDHMPRSEELAVNHLKQLESCPNSEPEAIRAVAAESSVFAAPMDKTSEESFSEQNIVLDLDNNTMQDRFPAVSHAKDDMTSLAAKSVTSDTVSPISRKNNDANNSIVSIPELCHIDAPSMKDAKEAEVKETKKASERKSRKQKNAKSQLVMEHGMGSSKAISSQQGKVDFENVGVDIGGRKALQMEIEDSSLVTSPLETGPRNLVIFSAESVASQHAEHSLPAKMTANVVGPEGKSEWGEVEMPSLNSQTSSSHRAWKPAPGLKPKSLLEIQQEEQRKVQTETIISEVSAMTVPTNSLRTPWVGVLANTDPQSVIDVIQNPTNAQATNSSITPGNRKTQLHDLLTEEVLTKSNEGTNNIPNEKGLSLPPLPQVAAQVETQSVDDDFVEAKDTKKGRKKAAKAAKASGLKASPPVASAYLSSSPVSVEKSKSTRQTQQEKELVPIPHSGPSLGDFVLWKEDQTNSPALAWSTDSTKPQKPASLRDILREQEKKIPSVHIQIPIPTPPKVQSNRGNRGSGSSWPVAGSSPSKTASPIQTKAASPGHATSLTSSQSKSRIEEDLFWGPLDQSKQETKKSEFGSSTKVAPVVASSTKGKRDSTTSKQSEAMDFKDWCESELVRLTGSQDTSFLEFCLKQSTAEAEMLLKQYLGAVDRNQEFIDKLLNSKDFLSEDVIELAFSSAQSNQNTSGDTIANKKKGKKGKKVNPGVLGFNVVSSRIMMGEIQTIGD